MADILIFDSHQPALEAGTYKISISQDFSVPGNKPMEIVKTDLDFIVAGEQYTIDEQQIDSIFPPSAAMGDFSLVLPHIILKRSTLPWERDPMKGGEGNPWLALLLFTQDELSATEEITEGKLFCVQHVLKDTWQKPDEGAKGDLISILVYNAKESIDNIIPKFSELPYLAHVRANGEDQKAVIVCNRLPKIDKKNIVHLVSFENCFDDKKEFSNQNTNPMALVSLKSWEFFCNDHFIITSEVLDQYKTITKQDDQGNLFVNEGLSNALTENIGKEYFDESKLADDLGEPYKSIYNKDKTLLTDAENVNLSQIKYILKTFRIGHLPDILKHLNRTPSTLRLPVQTPEQFPEQGFITAPYTLKTGKQIEALYRGPFIPGLPGNAISNPICIRHADEALRYFKDAEKLDISYAAAWQLGKLLAIQNKNFSTALYKWKRLCYQTIKQNKEVSASNCPVPALVSDWFSNVKNLNGIPFNYLVPDPSFTPFESIRFFNIDENWIMYLIDGAFSIGRISEAEGRYDNLLYNNSFNFLKAMPTGRSGFLLHSSAVAGWPDLVVYDAKIDDNKFNGPDGYSKCANEGESYEFINNADVAYGANGTFTFENGVSGNISFDNKRFGDPIPGIYKAGYYKFHKNKLSPNLLLCHFNRAINAVSIHQKPAAIHFGFEDIDENDKLFNGDTKISYAPVNSPDEAKKIDLSNIQVKSTAELVNELVQKIEVITFQAR